MADHPPPPDTAAIVAAIADGRLDDGLADLADAINDRRARTEAEHTQRALQALAVDTPAGRFTDGHINCSPRVLHPITENKT